MTDFTRPEQRKYKIPIVDAHVHLTDSPASDRLVEVAKLYGIDRLMAVSSLPECVSLKRRFGDFVNFALWPDFSKVEDAEAFSRRNEAMIEKGARNGAVALKFWFKPEFNYERKIYLDDKRLKPLFEKMAEKRFAALVHIADPDIWFVTHYSDEKKYLSKRKNYEQLEGAMEDNPEVNFVVAHFGGDPEDLAHLEEMLEKHDNFYIDTSATKWISRELSKKPDEAKRFIVKNAGRILFGTDLVTFRNGNFDYYASRYFVQQRMWEGEGNFITPIKDSDAGGQVEVKCFDLSEEILKKIYYDNAVKVYCLENKTK